MTLTILAEPDEDMPSCCYDDFSCGDEDMENFLGLAYCDEGRTGYFLIEYIDKKFLAGKGYLTFSDGKCQPMLLIHKKDWKKKEIQELWQRAVSTPIEKIIQDANPWGDTDLRDWHAEQWAERDYADRVETLIRREIPDLKLGMIDNVTEEILKALIDIEVEDLVA